MNMIDGAFHARSASFRLPVSDCTSCLNVQLELMSRYVDYLDNEGCALKLNMLLDLQTLTCFA